MQRLREFDFVRALAALSVIVIHVTGIYVYSSRPAYLWNQAVRYAVPLFIILSGLLLAYSYKAKDRINYLEFLQKRFKKIFIPYLLWSAIYTAFNLRGKYSEAFADIFKFTRTFLKNIAYGTSELHLYFVIIILQMYLLYPLLSRLLARWKTATLAAAFCITVYFQTGIYFSNIRFVRILPKAIVPYYETFMPWIFFFVFGMYAVERLDSWKEKYFSKKSVFVIVWLISFAALLADSIITKTNADSIKPTVMLYCMTSFFLFYLLALGVKETKGVVGQLADWFSNQSFIIYLSHILIQGVLRGIVNRVGLPGLWEGSLGMVLLFGATVLCTMLFVYIASFTPVAPWLGGVNAKAGISLINKAHKNTNTGS